MPTTAFSHTVEDAVSNGRMPTRRTVDVVDVRELTPGVIRLTFRDEFIAENVKPAQFVNLYSANPQHLMPRPFGVSEVDGDDVSLIFAVVGYGTDEFAHLKGGDRVDVLGPLGKPFDIRANADYLLVGGGLGIPPLLEAAQALQGRDDCRAIAVLGYRDAHFADVYAAKYADEVHSIDESEGNVLTLLERLWPGLQESGRRLIILSCGPTPMMKAVAEWASKRGVDAQLSMEQRMGCGYGTCVACTIDTRAGREKVCEAGPVFTAHQLGWDNK
ncbi:dihydroorotate dehydrogenase electron transfer subunit [Bifidobacterium sp. AGR2158]|uniref:dihydroorotate dehydrogenase electron transfer subunit n=1 Tax=Bifidobacterium sp. AGR2158 TaxID=1280675 RepID=UPI00047CA65A|nr:dihydroorotate dehydrogenase electron transfer subunit [Bifidobacterium sp. AGR2158]